MILITGGGGFLGLNTARELVDRGQNVLLVRRNSFELPSFLSAYADGKIKTAMGDIGETSFLYGIIKKYDVESIIHLASIHEGLGSLHQVFEVNVEGTRKVLEAANVFGLRRVTFCSSIGVYRIITKHQVLHEDLDLPARSDGYISATKKICEQICRLYAKEYGMSIPCVRPSIVWGPMYWSGLQPQQKMIENAVVGNPTDLSHICGQTRKNLVYVRDCARAMSLVHRSPSLKHDIYNISDGETHRLAEFAEAILEFIPDAKISLGSERTPADVDLPVMSIERIREDLGFTPEYDLRRGMKAYIDWLRHGGYN